MWGLQMFPANSCYQHLHENLPMESWPLQYFYVYRIQHTFDVMEDSLTPTSDAKIANYTYACTSDPGKKKQRKLLIMTKFAPVIQVRKNKENC